MTKNCGETKLYKSKNIYRLVFRLKMSSQQRHFHGNLSRDSSSERRRREHLRRRILLSRFRSNDSEAINPRSTAIPVGRNQPRTSRRNWRDINKDCLRLIEDCQDIIGRLQSNVNHLSNENSKFLSSTSSFVNHDNNLVQLPPEVKPESRFGNMLEKLNRREHYQPPFITSQTIQRLMSPVLPSSSLCPLQIVEVSLVCPLSKTKIKLPIRSKHCRHLGCCDASTFLSLVGEKPLAKWKCPICSLPMPYEDIKVDGLLFDVIKKVEEDTTKIEFTSSTQWRVKEEKGKSLVHKLDKVSEDEVIDLTDSPQEKSEEEYSNFIDLTDSP